MKEDQLKGAYYSPKKDKKKIRGNTLKVFICKRKYSMTAAI